MKSSIYPSAIETARSLILHLLEIMNEASDRIVYIALSGGSTPAQMFGVWAADYADCTPWERMRIFWVDERCVSPEHSDSNYGMTRRLLLENVPIAAEHIHRIHGEYPSAEQAAAAYVKQVKEWVPQREGWPEFDLVLLGVGEDGHTSSIFPEHEDLLFAPVAYAATVNPYNGQQRIAMTGGVILHARHVIFLVTGSSKADVIRDICQLGDVSPAAYIAHRAHRVELFMDEAAAIYIQKA